MFISHVKVTLPSFDSLVVRDLENPYGIELSKNRDLKFITKPLTKESYIARTELFSMHRVQDEVAFKWVMKLKWHIQDNDLRKKVNKEVKPRGLMLLALLDLCINLHPWLSDNYRNYAELFSYCKLDMDWQIAHHCFNCDEQDLGSKNADTKKEREIIANLKCGENPYDCEFMPAMAKLFDVALDLGWHDHGQPKKPFSDQWYAFIKSYKSWVEHLDVYGKSTFISGEKLYEQIGKGKQKALVKRNVF